MEIKQLVKLLAMNLLISQSLVACVGGNTQQVSNNASSATKMLNIKSSDLNVLETDLYKINYGNSQATTPQCSNGVCVTLNAVPYAIYSAGLHQQQYWLQPSYLTSFTVNFSQTINNDFHISRIYNELAYNPQTKQYDTVIGHIGQIDTSDCDNLIATGSTLNKSCKINLNYVGDSMDNQNTNLLHIDFSWNNNQNQIKTSFVAQNKTATDAFNIKNNLPIIQPQQTTNINILPEGNADNSDIDYIWQRSLSLVNNGNEKVAGNYAQTPTINVAMGLPQALNEINNIQMMYVNALITDCGDGDALSGQNCDFPFANYPLGDKKSIKSQLNNLLIQYKATNDTNAQVVNYVQPINISIGDIISKDYALKNMTYNDVLISKANLGTNGLNYSLPLKNLKFYAKVNPKFRLNNVRKDKFLEYSYGDFMLDGKNATHDWQKIAEQVSFEYDDKCFSSGFDPQYDGYELKSTRDCSVKIRLNNEIDTTKLNVIGLELYASYDSPTEHRHIEQFIGNLSSNEVQLPGGNYKDNFYNIKYEDGVLSGTMRSLAPFMSFLNYDEQCASNSTVGVIHNTSNNLTLMKCDTLAAKFPQGSYSNSCTNVEFDGAHLSALCQADGQSGGEIFVDGKLDYAQQCKANSTVSNNHGHLQCDVNK